MIANGRVHCGDSEKKGGSQHSFYDAREKVVSGDGGKKNCMSQAALPRNPQSEGEGLKKTESF